MLNFDINVDRLTKGKENTSVAKPGGQGDVSCKRADEGKRGRLCRKVRRLGRCFMQGLMAV